MLAAGVNALGNGSGDPLALRTALYMAGFFITDAGKGLHLYSQNGSGNLSFRATGVLWSGNTMILGPYVFNLNGTQVLSIQTGSQVIKLASPFTLPNTLTSRVPHS